MTESFIHTELWKMTVLMFVCSFILASIFVSVYHVHKTNNKYGQEKEEEWRMSVSSLGVGCLGTPFLLMANIGGFGSLLFWLTTGQQEWRIQASYAESKRDDLVSVMTQKHPSVTAHYDELKRLILDTDAYIKALEQELKTISSASERSNCARKLNTAKKKQTELLRHVRRHEECAGELYFAQFLTNLGTRFHEDEILSRLEEIYEESKIQIKSIK